MCTRALILRNFGASSTNSTLETVSLGNRGAISTNPTHNTSFTNSTLKTVLLGNRAEVLLRFLVSLFLLRCSYFSFFLFLLGNRAEILLRSACACVRV